MFASLSTVQDDNQRIRKIYLRTLNVISLFTFPLCLGLLVLAEPFVLAVYGPQWSASVPLVRIFALVGVTQSIGTTTGIIYQAKGRTDILFRWGMVCGLVICGAFVLGIQWGLTGLATAYLIAAWGLHWFNFTIPGKLIGLTYRDVFRAIHRNLLGAIVMAGAVFIVLQAIQPVSSSSIQNLLAGVVAGTVTYAILVRLLNPAAYSELRQILSSIRGRPRAVANRGA